MCALLPIAASGVAACQHAPVAAKEIGDATSATASTAALDKPTDFSDASIALGDAGSTESSDAAAALLAVPAGMFGFAPCSGPAADAYARFYPGDPRKPVSERSEPLGAHYTKRSYSVRSGGFEGLAHYEELRCGIIVLSSPVDSIHLSPDGNYVAYADGMGHNLVHGFVSGNIQSATPKPYVLPRDVKWDLSHKQVTVLFPAPTKPITVALP